ncbi:UbiA prenyltransferase family protein [Candidatus Woesearchaeota archaeon]|nr:UbiA prenyltransferase family protein [Candidatus Woesearchaeota archaeon]
MGKLFSLLRVHQWYKNLLVFLPIVFGQQISNIPALEKTIFAFFSLCFASSAYYIINDIIDRKKDIHHPEAHKKYIAKGDVSVFAASVLMLVLLLLSFGIAYTISVQFIYFVIALFALAVVYSAWLKDEIFVDVIVISANFVLRAVSGAFVVITAGRPYIQVSPWLLICTFLLALFLAVGKRDSELIALGKNAGKYKKVLKYYTPQMTSAVLIVSTSALLISYLLYSFQSFNRMLMFTAPFAVYVIFRYLYLVYSGSKIPLSPGRFYKDGRLVIGALLWVVSVLYVIYAL